MAFRRPSLRAQVVVLIAVVVVGAAALAWSRTIADDGDIVRLDEPGEYVDPAVSNPPNDGDMFPEVELLTAAGSSTVLRPDGRPMVVNLWYSTCPPCARELTYFAAVESELADEVRFVGVNPLDDVEEMQRFAEERGVDYELLTDHDGALGDALRVTQFPVTLFVAADGHIVAQTGAVNESDLRHHVDELVT